MVKSMYLWYIYLDLVDFYGKCRYIYHKSMDPMGYTTTPDMLGCPGQEVRING